VIVRLGIGDGEADRDEVEERRIGRFGAPAAEIFPGMEDKLEEAGARMFSVDQRRVGSSVRVGRGVGDELALASPRELVKLDPDSFRRPAAGDVEDVRRKPSQVLLRSRRQPSAMGRARHSIAAALRGPPSRFSMRD
jgi:hypothetical protein